MTTLRMLLVWVCLCSGLVRAQDTQTEYQSLVQKGLLEYELGNYSEARVFFLRAHQLSPNARTLRSLGMTSYEIRQYVEAQVYFQQALASETRPLTAQMRDEVTQLLNQARTFITRLQLTVSPADAQVRVDTHDVTRDADGTILLDPGTHELTVEARNHDPTTRSIRSDGSETLTLAIRLQPTTRRIDPPLAAAGPPHAAAAPGSLAPYILMAGSAAVAVAGAVLLTIALNHKHAVENPDPNTPEGPHFADYEAKANSVAPLSAAGISALSAGGLGLAASLIWKLSTRSQAPETQPSTSLTLTPTALTLHGRF